eukprot:XP_016662715.1 PREDICTED: uncharacterized protein LOC107884648 [Acyrthosiphon pisum]
MSHFCDRPPLQVDYKIRYVVVVIIIVGQPLYGGAVAAMKLDSNMNVMSRSNTWPVVVVRLEHDGGVHVIDNGPSDDGPCTAATDDLTGLFGGVGGGGGGVDANGGGAAAADTCPLAPLSARKRATLQRHYYPEGGWGWVIVATAVAVHVLNHGLQLSAAVMLRPAADKHGQPVVNTGQ